MDEVEEVLEEVVDDDVDDDGVEEEEALVVYLDEVV